MLVGKRGPEGERWSSAGRGHLPALALFVVLSLAMLYPLPLRAGTHVRDLGDPLEYAWVLGYSGMRLLQAPLRLYDANIYYPFETPLAYSDSTIASTVTVLPVLLTTGNPVLAVNLLVILSFILSGFGTYLLVAHLTGNRLAGVVAGVIFALNPYRIDHQSQIPNVAAHWIPFAFWALHRFLDGLSRRWAVMFGVFLALECLSSFYYAYALVLALAVYFLGLCLWQPRRVLRPAVVVPLLAAGLAAGAILLATSMPYFAVSQRYGMRRTLEEAAAFAARPQHYLAVPANNLTWGRIPQLVRWGDGERNLFPGLLALALAATGLAKGKPRGLAPIFAVVGFVAFVLSLGPSLSLARSGPPIALPFPMPYTVLFEYLPGFQSLRVPPRLAIVVMLAIAGLAGLGTAYLMQQVPRLGVRRWRATPSVARSCLAVVLTAVVLAEYTSFPIPMEPIATGSAIPEVYNWLRRQPEKQVLVELPIDDDAFHQAPYEYFSVYHGWTLVNGWRSFSPPGYADLAKVLQRFPAEDSLAALADLKVRYVVLHSARFPGDSLARIQARLAEAGDRVRLVQQFGPDYVYAVSQPPAADTPRLSVFSPPVASAGSSYIASLLVGGASSRPLAPTTGPRSPDATATWRSASGERFEQNVQLDLPGPGLSSGRMLPLALSAPPKPGAYELSLRVGPALGFPVTGPPAKLVVVCAPWVADVDPGSARPLQVTGLELTAPAYPTDAPIPVRVTWKVPPGSPRQGVVFVNVYDAQFRVWSVGTRQLGSYESAERVFCGGDQSLDLRQVTLAPNTPPGYYWLEVGVLDPTTGKRRLILDPAGRLVDRVTSPPLRLYAGRAESSKPSYPTHADLDGQVELTGWASAAAEARPGSDVDVRLYWHALSQPAGSYTVFVHLYDAAGKLVAQHDGQPGGGAWPTSLWQPGDSLEDVHRLHLSADLGVGSYTLVVGMYDPGDLRRLRVVAGADAGSDRIVLGDLRVVAGPSPR